MLERTTAFVVLDLASVVVFGAPGVRRCVDTALRACDADEGIADERVLRQVCGALERVLVAHVTCDPFVHAAAGARLFLSSLRVRGLLPVGVGSFSAAVAGAIARRFGWQDEGLLIAPSPRDGEPLWSSALRVVAEHGWTAAHGVFLSDDNWELASASARGCPLPLAFGPRSGAIPAPAVTRVRTLAEALATIDGVLAAATTTVVEPAAHAIP
jgi:hypothetical protein